MASRNAGDQRTMDPHLIDYRIQPYRRAMFVICLKRLRVISTLVVHHLSRALGLQESSLR